MNVHLTVFEILYLLMTSCTLITPLLYTLSINGEQWWGDTCFFHKNRITLQMSSWEQVSNGIATGHQLIAWIASDRLFCYLLCVITNKRGTSHQKILVNAGLRQSYRTKEPYLFNMLSIYHTRCYTPVSALPEMLWTTRGLLLCRRKSQTSMAPSTRVM